MKCAADRMDLDEPMPLERGALVLSEVAAFLDRFIAYPSEHAKVAHTLWIAHTHAMDAWESTPRIAFLSPEPGSGKTRALELTETLVPRPLASVNVTPAYVFRRIGDEAGTPTILHDEIDAVFGPRAQAHEDLRALLNAGHRRGATAGRCVVKGKQIETEELPAYCAVALAGLGDLPDTILTRSVIVRMRRRAPSETVEPYRHRVHAPEGHEIQAQLSTWVQSVKDSLQAAWPDMPPEVTDRNADVWEPLIAIADATGGIWPESARSAAVTLVTASLAGEPSLGVRLLNDLYVVFQGREKMHTESILNALNEMDEAPWGDLRGKPLDSRRLGRLLAKYGVKSKTVRDDLSGKDRKGYDRQDLHDPWERYLSVSRKVSVTTDTSDDGDSDERQAIMEMEG